ncbi:MAG: hypothetical protein H2172_12475 [Opitutus sp.]|nr:hypothetical protein [Opitutus sp.]MCS6248690.1 hypothetical protein [Opitutus sp.]MCS6275918.1 hypothetical protein [Opitutus sp.]MCS6301015.1 hypothetical protein [Opitutus sp.]
MLALLTALAEALRLWLQLKVVSAQYDLQRRIEADIAADEFEINSLRHFGGDDNNRAADRLRDRVLRAQGIVAALPATSAPAVGGATGAQPGGDLHPTGG